MTDFRRFIDRSLPGERLINLERITFASYLIGDDGGMRLAINFVSGENLILKGNSAVVIWGYLTAARNCSTVVMGEEPNPFTLKETDS